MRVIKSLVLRTRDLIPTHLYSLLWVIRQQTMIEKYYFLNNANEKAYKRSKSRNNANFKGVQTLLKGVITPCVLYKVMASLKTLIQIKAL